MPTSTSPDLMTMLVNIGVVIPPIIIMMQTIAAVAGIWFVATALFEMWGVSHDGALKYIPGKNRFSMGSAAVQLVVGAFLSALGTLELVGVLTRTLTGNYCNSRMLSYSAPTGGGTLAENVHLATLALMGIFQIVGFAALVKALFTVNDRANNQANAGYGKAIAWAIGGIACWNFEWFAQMLNNTIGFKIFGLFTPA